MKIYTKTGDKGITGLFGGKRIGKSDLQVEAYGTLDELSSIIGMTMEHIHKNKDRFFLAEIQKNLYYCMAYLAGSEKALILLSEETKKLEDRIDRMEKKLPPLGRFILPQGGKETSWMHIARTVCRRAERDVVRYWQTINPDLIGIKKQTTPFKNTKDSIQYLNRLSDFFFVMARTYTKKNKEIKT